jgi:hypothetical protein
LNKNHSLKKSLFYITVFSFLITIISCKKEKTKVEPVSTPSINDSIAVEPELKEEPRLIVHYSLDSLTKQEEVDSLFSRFSKEEQRNIFLLNRIEPVRIGLGTRLMIPDTLLVNFLKYAPFPQKMENLDSIPKSVLISQRIQAFALYENGILVKWGPVSSGKLSTPTPNGLHYGNYKAKRKVSTVNDDWILPYYFNFMNFEGVGVHQYLLPGFPASHACVRLDMEDAKYIYDWAKQWQLDPSGNTIVKNGTPFMVFGSFDHNKDAPWFELLSDPDSNNINEEELRTIERYVQEYMKDEKNFNNIKKNTEEVLASR